MSERPACVGEDPELFFDPHAGATVARICARCPVTSCLADALEREERHGWWGGVYLGLPDDPMVVAEPAAIRPTVAAVHGNRGTYLHCTAGEDGGKCGPCREANRLYKANYDKNGPVTRREKVVDMQVPMFEGAAI